MKRKPPYLYVVLALLAGAILGANPVRDVVRDGLVRDVARDITDVPFATSSINFYADSVNGDDDNTGTAEDDAFQTLGALETAALAYGDGVTLGLLTDSEFTGVLDLSGISGATVQSVGSGASPLAWVVQDGAILAASGVTTPSYLSTDVTTKLKTVYGTRRLIKGYSGYAYQVFRESDSATLDVGFEADGSVDTDAVATWIGASRGRIAVWYDQSGNGYNLTQTTANDRPVWNHRGRSGEVGAIALHSNPAAAKSHMEWPVGLTTDGKDVSVLQVLRQNNRFFNVSNAPYPNIQLGTESTSGCISYTSMFSNESPQPSNYDRQTTVTFGVGGTFRNTGSTVNYLPPSDNLSLFAFKSTASGITARLAGKTFSAAAGSTFNGTGGQWGQSFGTSFPSSDSEGHALIVSTAYTTDEESQADLELSEIYQMGSPTNLLVWDGDSISAGYNNTTFWMEREESPSYLFRSTVGNEWDCYNKAWAGGNVTSGQTKDRVSPAPDSVDSLYDATQYTGRRVCVIMVGSNDITLATPDVAIQSRIQTYCEDRQSAGWEVFVCNIIPRDIFDAGQEASRVAINSWLASNYASWADGFVDVAGAVDWTDDSYNTYTQDGTHPNTAGVAVIEAAVRAVINP